MQKIAENTFTAEAMKTGKTRRNEAKYILQENLYYFWKKQTPISFTRILTMY